jgi:hypothetical protein
MDLSNSEEILPDLIDNLLSYEEEKYKDVLTTYFTEDAVLTHPILNVEGRDNIRKVFRVWTSLNKQPPKPTHLVFNGYTAVVNVEQHLRPRIIPFLHFSVPSVTVLKFREGDDGLAYIYKQEDNWTLEGLIRSVPLINWWYDNVVCEMVGSMAINMGSFLASANKGHYHLAIAANDVQQQGGDAMKQGQHRAIKYGTDLVNNVNSVFNKTRNLGLSFRKGSENHHYITSGEDIPEDSSED